MTTISKLGKCTCCRTRTAVTTCKVESYVDDPRAQRAELCEACRTSFKVAIVTPVGDDAERVTHVY